MDGKPRVLLVDLSNALVRAFSRLPEDKRNLEDLDYLVTGMVRKAIRVVKADSVALCLDTVELCWRFTIHPEYKAGRTKRDVTPKQLTAVVGPRLRDRGFPMLYDVTMEADDVLCAACNSLVGRAEPYVYTRDSDLYGLLNIDGVRLLWPENGGELRILDKEGVEADLGYPTAWVPQIRALTADRKDNLRGLLCAEPPQRCAITEPRAIEMMKWAEGSLLKVLEAASDPPSFMRVKEVEWLKTYYDGIVAIWEIARLRPDARLRVDPIGAPVASLDLKT